MSCGRCGWDPERLPPEEKTVANWPPHLPVPPPLPPYEPHTWKCPCLFSVNDEVYWDMGGKADDLPPIRGHFKALIEFYGPEWDLVDGIWVQVTAAIPTQGIVELDRSSVLQVHLDLLGAEMKVFGDLASLQIHELVPAVHWPVLA